MQITAENILSTVIHIYFQKYSLGEPGWLEMHYRWSIFLKAHIAKKALQYPTASSKRNTSIGQQENIKHSHA